MQTEDPPRAGARRVARTVVTGLGRSFPGSDFALWAAGATFFGLIGLVPATMVSLWLAALLVGPDVVVARVDIAVTGLPPGHGTPTALHTLATTAVGMTWVQALVAVFPASLYGEGLRRAFGQLSPVEGDRFTGWRGRLGLLPLIAVGPGLVLALLAGAPLVAPLYDAGGGSLVLGVVIAFHVVFVLVSVALVLVYRFVAPGRTGTRALLLAGFGTGSVMSGFLQGFLLFLAIPVEWSLPFGGLPVFGAVTALVLWLYLLHLIVLVGYRLALVLDDQIGSRG
ncbi:YhjD/YihY/BrkB family envelope integrity protein [Pseudonocardia humida]|uniref:YihY/virulence factor BrkB family protein n=1 Tax=Pseudonocardia humida TaxID=2800819 RepID=A0ABT1ACK2_9PSEU|nr:YhjD/YihY/BrkB family envelope integrity protein [Pseudonocardia humida]MCO1660349.1 YihY/virulence factor BrkB family protein [Pseudonocardia humida]